MVDAPALPLDDDDATVTINCSDASVTFTVRVR